MVCAHRHHQTAYNMDRGAAVAKRPAAEAGGAPTPRQGGAGGEESPEADLFPIQGVLRFQFLGGHGLNNVFEQVERFDRVVWQYEEASG